jgi:hypothetical protein
MKVEGGLNGKTRGPEKVEKEEWLLGGEHHQRALST